MSTEFKQSLRQDQSLAITPQLKRSLEILQAGALELRDIVDAELNTNPLLEELSNVDKSERPQTISTMTRKARHNKIMTHKKQKILS